MLNILTTPISGLFVIERSPYRDHRGAFSRLFCTNEFSEIPGSRQIMQINHSSTKASGAVRGMHFQQPPHAEMKFITCLKGKVFDVAVDIRQNSPTYLKWYAEILSPANNKSLVIPEGFAHGFQTLTDDCEMLYFHTAAYQSAAESGLHPLDPALNIQWPLAITVMSERDSSHSFLETS